MVQLSAEDRAYNRIVKVFDKAGFEVWSPNGHLNQDPSDAAGDIMLDDNPGWAHGTKEAFPLKARINFTSDEDAAALLARMKTALQKRGFRTTEELPNLTNGFSALAEGVRAEKTHSRAKGKHQLEIVISELPDHNL